MADIPEPVVITNKNEGEINQLGVSKPTHRVASVIMSEAPSPLSSPSNASEAPPSAILSETSEVPPLPVKPSGEADVATLIQTPPSKADVASPAATPSSEAVVAPPVPTPSSKTQAPLPAVTPLRFMPPFAAPSSGMHVPSFVMRLPVSSNVRTVPPLRPQSKVISVRVPVPANLMNMRIPVPANMMTMRMPASANMMTMRIPSSLLALRLSGLSNVLAVPPFHQAPSSVITVRPNQAPSSSVMLAPPNQAPSSSVMLAPPTQAPSSSVMSAPPNQAPSSSVMSAPPNQALSSSVMLAPPTQAPSSSVMSASLNQAPSSGVMSAPLNQAPSSSVMSASLNQAPSSGVMSASLNQAPSSGVMSVAPLKAPIAMSLPRLQAPNNAVTLPLLQAPNAMTLPPLQAPNNAVTLPLLQAPNAMTLPPLQAPSGVMPLPLLQAPNAMTLPPLQALNAMSLPPLQASASVASLPTVPNLISVPPVPALSTNETVQLKEDKEFPKVKWTKINAQAAKHSVIPLPRHGHRACRFGHQMIMFGGGNEGIFREVNVYNTLTNEWSQPEVKGNIPTGKAAYGAAIDGHRILIFGGMEENVVFSDLLYELNIPKWEWTLLTPFSRTEAEKPSVRMGHSFTLMKERVFMFGGLTNLLPPEDSSYRHPQPQYLNELHILLVRQNMQHGIWEVPTTFGTPPSPRESHSAVGYVSKEGRHNKLVIYGGMFGNRLGDVHTLDIDTMMWSAIKYDGRSNLPAPRSLHTASLVGDRMYVFGGWVTIGSVKERPKDISSLWKCDNTIACLNLKSMTWEKMSDVAVRFEDGTPGPRAGHSAVVIDSKIYIWSGRDGYIRDARRQQHCYSELWKLDVQKPSAPAKVKLIKALSNMISVGWEPVVGADGYILQVLKFDMQPTTTAVVPKVPGSYGVTLAGMPMSLPPMLTQPINPMLPPAPTGISMASNPPTQQPRILYISVNYEVNNNNNNTNKK